ncbi:hypothetical protein NDU88_004898 [Pleurodeles waltl]|uniref:Uncharacterized protein n=1 Tax=Pleurodeles waltl TaxID=8319 RepID=A0AAV7SK78_PLEWA|nr:hypothetical protein NDU88_004898 [Pleurodeles waltl]
MGAATDAWDSDFRVPGTEKKDGLEKEEEFPMATDARGEHRELENMAGASAGEGETGKSELPKMWARFEEKASQQETSAFRHAPGMTWLNKVLSLFQGHNNLTKTQSTGERGARQEGRVAEGED